MEQTNSRTADFYQKSILKTVSDEEFASIYSQDALSKYKNILSISSDAGYIIDFQKRCFHYVSSRDLFLCGYSQEDVMRLGYDFYPYIVHKDDLQLLAKMHCAVLNSPYIAECQENIAHFSFTVRIKMYPDITSKTEYQMIYHRLKPVFFNRKLCFGICMMNVSALRTSGNLRVYFGENKHSFDEYSFINRLWKTKPAEHLTEREIFILKLAKQGVNNKEIADKIGIKYETLRNINTSIHQKLGVETMEQAIVFATNHLMLFDTTREDSPKDECETKNKQHYRKLPQDRLEYIQDCLDKGQSVNSLAKEIGIARSSIRHAVKTGKLVKK
ncbi:MAG: helix-turn-helix transcriptional regulator [Prevotellaceae bacterium]|jgi:DNA-binding NarL/FixJ family response regulator|nr:helix-turn-helix transcriptional regulator [Prevotellaceae bacterium]